MSDATKSLSPLQRKAIRILTDEGYSVADISAVLDINTLLVRFVLARDTDAGQAEGGAA